MVLIPLKPGTKTPAVSGWAAADYEGVKDGDSEWVGLRADNLVIVDCDSQAAAEAWQARPGVRYTKIVETPRGYHYYYEAGPGAPTGPAVGVLPGVDIRAGHGSYVVCPPTPGYRNLNDGVGLLQFNPASLPERTSAEPVDESETWTTIPKGQRNGTLTSLAGTLRKQGMAMSEMAKMLEATNTVYCNPPLGHDEVLLIVQSVCRYEPDPDFDITIIEDDVIEGGPFMWSRELAVPPPPEWFWRPYIPRGRLIMLDGREGIGKGMLCAWLATLMCAGRNPHGVEVTPQNVLWFPAEDDPEEDILRRLKALGHNGDSLADVAFVMDRLQMPRDEAKLTAMIEATQPGLVVLDPGRSYLGPPEGITNFSYNDESHIRPGMESLIRTARMMGTTIVFVHHWNKSEGMSLNSRAGGSGAFNQAIRHRITIVKNGEGEEAEWALGVVKSNIERTGYVSSAELAVSKEWDTAYWSQGNREPFSSLEEWIEDKAKEAAKETVMSPESQAFMFLDGLPVGSTFTTPELIEQSGLSRKNAQRAVAALAESGMIDCRPGMPHTWKGEPNALGA